MNFEQLKLTYIFYERQTMKDMICNIKHKMSTSIGHTHFIKTIYIISNIFSEKPGY